jgi:hypothetical protein
VIDRFARAAKAWFAAVVAGTAVLELAVTIESDGGVGVTTGEWYRVFFAVIGSLAITYNVTNRPPVAQEVVPHA